MKNVNQKYVAKVVAEMADHRYLYLIPMPRKYATTVVMVTIAFRLKWVF